MSRLAVSSGTLSPFTMTCGASPAGLWALAARCPSGLAQPRAHAGHLQGHSLWQGSLRAPQLLGELGMPCRGGEVGLCSGSLWQSEQRAPTQGQRPRPWSRSRLRGRGGAAGSWGSGLGEQTFEGLAWGPGAHPQTCLDRQLTTKGVIQLRCTWLPGTPGNPRLGAALAENQDSSPRPPRQHPSIPASPGPPRPEPPPAPGTASSVPWAAPGACPAVPPHRGVGHDPLCPQAPGPRTPVTVVPARPARPWVPGPVTPTGPGCLPGLLPEAPKRSAGRGRLRGEAQFLAFHLMGPSFSPPKLSKL